MAARSSQQAMMHKDGEAKAALQQAEGAQLHSIGEGVAGRQKHIESLAAQAVRESVHKQALSLLLPYAESTCLPPASSLLLHLS